tara:strand:+ start:546 stop:1523 length:978 start_codon:yes stop_codon:yes gene_type:complete
MNSNKTFVDKSIQVNMDDEKEETDISVVSKTIKLKNIKKLVFGGGFLKGYALYGCIKFLMENNALNNITTYIGSSIGSVILLLLVLDYKDNEIQHIIKKCQFKDYENFTIENIVNFTEDFGVDNGEKITQFIKNIIYSKTRNYYITFQQLYDINKKTFVVTGTNLKLRKCEYFSHLTTPNMPIWIAIRISTSFPFFFTKVNYKNIDYIDGAATSSCAIEFIEDNMNDTLDDTLCAILYRLDKFDNNSNICNQTNTCPPNKNIIISYIRDLFSSLRYQDFIRFKKYKYNLLEIDVDFDLYKEDINTDDITYLITRGYDVTKSFFEG